MNVIRFVKIVPLENNPLYVIFTQHTYHNRQKLSERKVSQFAVFHPNGLKTFAVFASSLWKVLKKAIAELRKLSKIHKNHKTFLSLNFCHLRYNKRLRIIVCEILKVKILVISANNMHNLPKLSLPC